MALVEQLCGPGQRQQNTFCLWGTSEAAMHHDKLTWSLRVSLSSSTTGWPVAELIWADWVLIKA